MHVAESESVTESQRHRRLLVLSERSQWVGDTSRLNWWPCFVWQLRTFSLYQREIRGFLNGKDPWLLRAFVHSHFKQKASFNGAPHESSQENKRRVGSMDKRAETNLNQSWFQWTSLPAGWIPELIAGPGRLWRWDCSWAQSIGCRKVIIDEVGIRWQEGRVHGQLLWHDGWRA